jgi:hypothetical protein
LHGCRVVILNSVKLPLQQLHIFRRFSTIYPLDTVSLPTSYCYSAGKYRGYAVAQLVKALRYKPEGGRFDSRWCYWNFSLTQSFRPHYGPEDDSASNRNEYQEYFPGGKGGPCVELTTLPPSCADCLDIWEPQHPGNLRACPDLLWDCLLYQGSTTC